MRRLTVDGKFCSLLSYHFVIINHFRHHKCISLAFYLVSSLNNSIRAHEKCASSLVLHEGLFPLIMKYAKTIHVERNTSAKTGIEYKKNVHIHYGEISSDEEVDFDGNEVFHIYNKQGPSSSKIPNRTSRK